MRERRHYSNSPPCGMSFHQISKTYDDPCAQQFPISSSTEHSIVLWGPWSCRWIWTRAHLQVFGESFGIFQCALLPQFEQSQVEQRLAAQAGGWERRERGESLVSHWRTPPQKQDVQKLPYRKVRADTYQSTASLLSADVASGAM